MDTVRRERTVRRRSLSEYANGGKRARNCEGEVAVCGPEGNVPPDTGFIAGERLARGRQALKTEWNPWCEEKVSKERHLPSNPDRPTNQGTLDPAFKPSRSGVGGLKGAQAREDGFGEFNLRLRAGAGTPLTEELCWGRIRSTERKRRVVKERAPFGH